MDTLALVLSFQLPVAVYRFWAREETEGDRNRVLGGAMLLTLVAPTLLLLPVYIRADYFSLLLDLPGHANLLRLVLVEAQLGMIVTVVMTEMRVQDHSGRFAIWEFAQVVGMGLLSVLLVAGFHLGIWGMFLAQTAVFAAMAMSLFPGFLKRVGLRYDPALTKDMLRFALPLVPSALALAALNSADRFFLHHMVGIEATGLYSIGYKFGMLVNILVIGPFFLIWEPRRFAIANEPNAGKTYGQVFTYLLVLTSFIALALTGLAGEIVQILTAREYWQAHTIVPLIAWSYVFFALSSVVNVGLFVHHRTGIVSWLVVVALLANTVGNLLLIPIFGAHGAAIATFLSFFLLFALNLAFSHRFIAIAFEWRKLALLSGLLLAAGLSMTLVSHVTFVVGIVFKSLVLLCFVFALFAFGFFERLRLFERIVRLASTSRARWLFHR
jgi:O-antigen/teichoic acid export membrane protein